MINYGKQCVSDEDIAKVIETLRSDFLTQGPKVPEFETAISRYTGVNYASAVSSATAGLHLGCLALGVGKDDIVWTSTNSFVASANAALYCGARIDFIDIDLNTNNICLEKLKLKLQLAKKLKKLPKLLIPVHLTGLSCEMKEIHKLSKEYNFKILEDASHCIGGDYLNNKIGSCEFSDACVFSFHPVKIITTGEGGAITTNKKKIDSKIKALRSHGIKRGVTKPSEDYMPYWYYEQFALGFNYRMTDIQASLGLSQLKQVDKFIELRRKIANFYDKNINSYKITKPDLAKFKDSSFHLYVIKINNRNDLYEYLKENQIATNVHYFPIHMQPYYQNLGFRKGDFPNAEEYGRTAISIPIYSSLSIENQKNIVNLLNNFQ
tara:strand:+ start:9188 stop:10324 length:1137 start_codon:yes stop_codon:yes gene_type:complete